MSHDIFASQDYDGDNASTETIAEVEQIIAEFEDDPNGAVIENFTPVVGNCYTLVRAISARINQNYDAWPSDELREAHHTFIGKPVFVNHNNHDPDRARGRVVASRYVDAGEDDRYIQVLQEVEATRFPMLAKELMEGGLDSVSMGAEAREVECSFCSNVSTSPWDACEHIPLKGSTLQRRTASGQPEDVLVYEVCRKISFFELSYVFDPADETAVASNVLVANRRESLSDVEVPPKVDTLHPDEDEKSQDDWQEFVDDPNVIDTIDVLDEPDLGLNQQLERADDELPEGFEEFEDVDERIEENEQAEKELAQDSREKSKEKEEAEAEKAQEQFEKQQPDEGDPDPEDDENWEDEDDGTGGTTKRFKGGSVEAMVADDYGTFNMWVEKNGQLIASDSYASFREAKAAAVSAAKEHLSEWAGYKDFEDCKQQNSNAEDPDAYCGEVKHRVEKGREGNVLKQGKLAQYEDLPTVPQSNHPSTRKAGSETFGVRDLQNHEDSLGVNVREGAHPAPRTSDEVRSSQQGTSSGVHEANVLEAETSSHRVSRGRVRSLRDEGPDSALDQSHRRSGRRGHQERAGATPGSPERPERVRPEMYELSETLGVREGGTQASQQRGVSPSSQMVDSVDAYCGEIKNRADKESKMSRTARRTASIDSLRSWVEDAGISTRNVNQENGGFSFSSNAGQVKVYETQDGSVAVGAGGAVPQTFGKGQKKTIAKEIARYEPGKLFVNRVSSRKQAQFEEVSGHSEGFGNSRVWVYWPMFSSGRGLVVEEDPSTIMWMIEDASGSFTKTEFADSVQDAQRAVDDYYHSVTARKRAYRGETKNRADKEIKMPRTSNRKKADADKDLYVRFLEYAKNQGLDLEHIENLYMMDSLDDDNIIAFEEAMYDFLDVDSVDDDPRLYSLLEAPGMYGIAGHILGKRKARRKQADDHLTAPGVDMSQTMLDGMGGYGDAVAVAFDSSGNAVDLALNWETAQSMANEGYNMQVIRGDGGKSQDEIQRMVDYEKELRNDLYGSRRKRAIWDVGDRVEHVFDEVKGTVVEVKDGILYGDDFRIEWDDGEESTEDRDRLTLARRNGARRTSRMKNRDISRKDSRMAPQRRRRTSGDNKQTPLLEDTGIAQTPAEEPVALPEEGDSHPNNSESDRVQTARRRLAREIARDRARKRARMHARRKQAYNGWTNWDTWNASLWLNNDEGLYNESLGKSASELRSLVEEFGITGDGFDVNEVNWDEVAEGFNDEAHYSNRRRRAQAVGEKLSGDSVDREDLFEDFPATNMTASRLRKRFATWVQDNYGSSLRQASGPGELRSWARAFSKSSGIQLQALHTAIKRDVVALRTAEDDDDNDLPDFIEEKIESDEDNPSKEDADKADSDDDDDDDSKEARRLAARRNAARRQAQARNARGRRTRTTRRRTADDKLDVAAPGDRVNVEKPTSGTTDDEAEASQFDRDDFDNNSGKGLENPDTTPAAGIPGGPSVNELKKSSRATGLQAVRLAEAMITAGLIENTNEAKYKAAAQFERMDRSIVLDRTALLEKVSKVHAGRRSNQKSAGNRGASLNSAVPPNMSAASRSSAPQTREASADNDSDLFF